MKLSNLPRLLLLSRVYVVVTLIIAIIFAPLVAVPIPILTLLMYLYLEFKEQLAKQKVIISLFLALSLPLLFKPMVGLWISPVFTIPILPMLDHNLREYGSGSIPDEKPSGARAKPSGLFILLGILLAIIVFIALAVEAWELAISCGVISVYLGIITTLVLLKTSQTPCQANVVTHRVIAGDIVHIPVRLTNLSKMGGQLRLISQQPWSYIRPDRLNLNQPTVEVGIHFVPPLAGSSTIKCRGTFVDPWGLLQKSFDLTLINMLVIPRAKYADWLARKYLQISPAGILGTTITTYSSKQRPSIKGIEYYGLRPYQPGDYAKSIDWKHTLKLQQVVVKEHTSPEVESAILLINLSASDEEEKDKVAYALITTALTLAREDIPSAFAAYNDKEVRLITEQLKPRAALIQALRLSREINIVPSMTRYLSAPDVSRLRSNINRLKQSEDSTISRLTELLGLEYMTLEESIKKSTATRALNSMLKIIKFKANVMIISGLNHDAEAIAFNQYALKQKGYQVLPVELDKIHHKILRQ